MSSAETIPTSGIVRYYRTKDRRFDFKFVFVPEGDHLAIYCLRYPPHGRDSDPNKTHLFSSGKICFVEGREPRTRARAEQLAAEWSEYILEYARTGIPQH
jgi:hypothetical protein